MNQRTINSKVGQLLRSNYVVLGHVDKWGERMEWVDEITRRVQDAGNKVRLYFNHDKREYYMRVDR